MFFRDQRLKVLGTDILHTEISEFRKQVHVNPRSIGWTGRWFELS